ncbi:LPD29 domain-containing protein [Pedobacter sp. Leaf170]|uniref:LPD29 domain-containing protein n=1 Tax=Pedobacter sp. Leaf170 TaxID=2876558 RepID=UPI001E64923D|nr:LPD29 domain-containing protein [Pedobacter sp. Leaf170]
MKAKRQPTEASIVSKTVKKLLTSNFKGIKFSVKSDIFSGGDSVSVKWSFGPTENEVNALIKRFQGGSFNSYEDIYEYNADSYEVDKDGNIKVQPTVKYISTSRRTPVIEEAAKLICEKFNVEYEGYWSKVYENDKSSVSDYAYRIINKMSFESDDIKIIACINKEKDCGMFEDIYTFSYENLKDIKPAQVVAKKIVDVKTDKPAKQIEVTIKPNIFGKIISWFKKF